MAPATDMVHNLTHLVADTAQDVLVNGYCEDYPCCGHTPQDPCSRQPYDEPDYYDTSKNPHAFCNHEEEGCTAEYYDPEWDEDQDDELDCDRSIALGLEDSATCDIPRSSPHSRHEGPTSLGGRASWEGGGTLMGDPLPRPQPHHPA